MKIQNAIFYLVLLEISLGGGGRLTSVGDVTLRMLLFLVAMIYTIVNFSKLKSEQLVLTFSFLTLLVFSSFVGVINNAQSVFVVEDIKILSYFPMMLFFYLNINSSKVIANVINLIKISSVALSAAYIIIRFGLELDFLDKQQFYDSTAASAEFMFRSDSIFLYKGLLFSSIGCFFFIFDGQNRSKWDRATQTLCVILIIYSIFMTYTRGLLIGLFGSGFLGYMFYAFNNRKISKIVFYVLIVVAFGTFFSENIMANISDVRSVGQDESDSIRLVTITQVFEMMTPLSILIGHGFGIGVAMRDNHMEISYLEIFHKQGLLGLSFYVYLLVKLIYNYSGIANDRTKSYVEKMQGLSFIAASIFVYIQSTTNPLINNPIGISVILISIVATDTIKSKSVVNNLRPIVLSVQE